MHQAHPFFLRPAMLVVPLVAGATLSCGRASISHTDATVDAPSVAKVGDVGLGWNSFSRDFAGQCVVVDVANIKDVTNASTSTADIKENMSEEEMASALHGALSGSVSIGPVNASAGASYANANAASSYASAHSIYIDITGLSRKIARPDLLTLSASGVDADAHKEKGLDLCGDQYVTQVDYGATFIATLKVEYTSATDRDQFDGNLHVSIADIGSLEGQLETLRASAKGHVSFQFETTQLGGVSSEITTTFGDSDTACGIEDVAACAKAFQAALTYAQNFHKQLEKPASDSSGIAVLDITKLAPIAYQTQNYAPQWTLRDQTISPIAARGVQARQEEVIRILNNLADDHTRAESIKKNFHVVPEQANALQQIIDRSQLQIDIYADAVSTCFSVAGATGTGTDKTSCQIALETAQRTVDADANLRYDPSYLIVVASSFGSWCKLYVDQATAAASAPGTPLPASTDDGGLLPASARSTVKAIVDAAMGGAAWTPQTISCDDVQTAVEGLRSLTLRGPGFANIDPVAAVPNLMSLIISGNSVSSLIPISSLRFLHTLDLSNTMVADLGPLHTLNLLQQLDVSGTHVSDLSPLTGLRELQQVTASNTAIVDLAPLAGMTRLVSVRALGDQINSVSDLLSGAHPRLQGIYVTGAGLDDQSECNPTAKVFCAD